MPPIIDHNKCVKCGYCAQICPLDVIKMESFGSEKKTVIQYPEECWHCRACEKDCPVQAIHMRYPLSHLMLHMEPDRGRKPDHSKKPDHSMEPDHSRKPDHGMEPDRGKQNGGKRQ